MRTLATMRKYRLVLFLAISQVLKICGTLNFNMGVNGTIVKYAIPWKRLAVVGTHGPRNCIYRVLLGQVISVQFGVIRCTLQNFRPMFSKGYCCHSFHPISTKLYGKHSNQGSIQVITFSGYLPKITTLMPHFDFFVNTGPYMYGAASFKTMPGKFYESIGRHPGIQVVTFFAIDQVLKKLWHFEI